MKGYAGKILFIDLNSGLIREEALAESLYRNFIGGVGLGVRVLYERMMSKVDPLGADNILGFMTGPLTGTNAPFATKNIVVAKSPLTGTWGDANCGGLFGAELKSAGYDAVFFSGIAEKPVYLFVHDGAAELRDAGDMWGKDTRHTEQILFRKLGEGVKYVCIGQAGESLSLIASVVADRGRVAARSGLGAVMGSKRLKAVVVKGGSKVEVADSKRLSALRKETIKYINDNIDALPFIKSLKGFGTCGGPLNMVPSGAAPIKNWTLSGKEAFPDYARIAGESIFKYQIKRSGCGTCPVNCSGIVSIKEGPYAVEGRKPEYESIAALGLMCMNTNAEAIIKAADFCDRAGIDTISAGTTISFAMECYEKGIITEKDTGGIELTWGNAEAILKILEKMASREGFGDVLADGVKKAAERIGKGAADCAIHIHGQEPGMHDPRFFPSRGMVYMCAAAPGRHPMASPAIRLSGEGKLGPSPELRRPEGASEAEIEGKSYALGSSYGQVFSDSGLCLFALSPNTSYPLVELISAVTGWDFTVKEAITAGRRVLTLLQLFNVREGWTANDFYMPRRLTEPPVAGPLSGRSIDFDELRSAYFRAIGWDAQSGIPSEQCITELGLKELVDKVKP